MVPFDFESDPLSSIRRIPVEWRFSVRAAGDGVIVAVSHFWCDRPTVLEKRAIALECRNNGHIDAVIDTLQQLRGLCVEVNAIVFRRV
jgi:hypothetical protein